MRNLKKECKSLYSATKFKSPTLRVVLPKITVVYYTGFYEETNCHHWETECNFTGAKSIPGKSENRK